MNREIKFRVWDRALNKMITKENVKGLLDTVNTGDWDTDYTYSRDEWYPAYDILTIFDYFESIQDRYIEDTSTKRFELMQYTGLHDKNGKEIYEGDVVLLTCYNYEEPVFGGKFKVIYDDINGMWLLIDLENKDRGFAFGEIRSYYKAEIEIISNIYDNPELLGGE